MILFSCKDYGNPLGPNGGDSDDGGDNLSYTDLEIQEIFDLNCITCHKPQNNFCGDPCGDLNLLSYSNVMNSDVVVPGDASSSELYDRITRAGSAQGDMPPTGSLSDEQIELIETWINDGALE